ncbi:core protein V [Human adenovirus 12]|nr:core protein V [Human adenovirus 12]WEG80017.2 core protein V [Human adenovirus 12]
MTKRKFKEELLQALAPEIYGPSDNLTKRDIKHVKKREKKEEEVAAASADGVEFVRSFAPRRRVQWKGRQVKRILRPGTTVVFSPGERTVMRPLKREYDEVYADDDILEQAAQQTGEFAYGKKGRYGDKIAIPLDEGNPTPSLKAVTLQQVLPVLGPSEEKRGIKREAMDELQPTMQLMVPKRQKLEDVLEHMKVDPSVQPDVKVRPIKKVAPGLGVQTVDIQIPVQTALGETMETQTSPIKTTVNASVQTDPWYSPMLSTKTKKRHYRQTSSLLPDYVLHPSIVPTPGYRGSTFQRRATTPSRRRGPSRRRRRRKATLAPAAVRRVIQRGRTLILPSVRYHPSIL